MTTITSNFGTPSVAQSEPLQGSSGQDSINQAGGNTVGNHSTPQQTSNSNPTDGARGATPNSAPGYADIERMTEERLMSNPVYRELKEKHETWKDIETDFALIDLYSGFIVSDGIVTLENLRAVANNDHPLAAGARAAAQRLLSNMSVWNEMAKGDNVVGTHDVIEFAGRMKDQLKGMKDAAREEIKAENGLTNGAGAGTPAPASGASNAATAAQTPEQAQAAAEARAVLAEAGQALPKPPASEFSGLEGATENLGNMIGWAEAEMDRLTTLMGKTDDPAALKQLELKINQMSRRMQQMTALMSQLTTAMQNISKMYSDIAMNSVRNIK